MQISEHRAIILCCHINYLFRKIKKTSNYYHYKQKQAIFAKNLYIMTKKKASNTYPIINTDGQVFNAPVYQDINGNAYTVDGNGDTYYVERQNTFDSPVQLDAVNVYAPSPQQMLDKALSEYSIYPILSKDNTRVFQYPYRKEPTSTTSYVNPMVEDNVISRIVSSISSLLPAENKNQYENSLSPYTYKDDIEPYGRVSDEYLTTGNEVSSRLGNLGLTKVGNNLYRLYDKNGNKITECAKTRNELEKMTGHPTTNNAWDASGMYGDSTLFNGYLSKVGPYSRVPYLIQNQIAALRTKSALKDMELQTGDIVDLYSTHSHYAPRAYREGTLNRSNSHTGMVFQPYPGAKAKTYVIHNVNGNITVDPIGKFIFSSKNLTPKWQITGLHRPGTKEHPYLENGKPAHL